MKQRLFELGLGLILCATLATPAAWAQPIKKHTRHVVAQQKVITYQRPAPAVPTANSGVASDPYWQLDDMANVAACREFAQIANMKFGSFPPGRVWGVPFAYPGGGAAPPSR